jgi:hypothetical protein
LVVTATKYRSSASLAIDRFPSLFGEYDGCREVPCDCRVENDLFWAIIVFHFLVHGRGAWSIAALTGREV